MGELDAHLTRLIERELSSGEHVLESCTAGSRVLLPTPWRFLVPAGIVGFAILSLATGLGILSLVSLGLIVWSLVYTFTRYRRYVLAVTEHYLLMIQVASNIASRLDARKLPYEKILLCAQSGSGTVLNVDLHTADETIKLMLGTRERKLSDSAARASRLAEILKAKVSGS